MTRSIRALVSLVAVASVITTHSATPAAQQRAEAISRRIAELTAGLENFVGGSPREASGRDNIANAIRSEVERFVETSVNPSAETAEAEFQLRGVLRAHVPRFDASDPPKARVAGVRNGRSLVIAYSIVRPPHFDLPTIAAFAAEGSGFRLVDKTGEDFEGHTLATLDVPSPARDVMWILAHGQAFGFNGSMSRLRIYAFDGGAFETIWSKDGVLSANVKVLPDGFELTHYVRELRADVTEQYRSTPSGVVRVQ